MLSQILAALPPLDLLLFTGVALFTAYAIFGITGFGSGLIAAPVLAQLMPVAAVVPMLAIVDCAAALTNGVRLGGNVDRKELFLFYPATAIGSLIGAILLFHVPTRAMMFALGLFIIAYACWSFFVPQSTARIGAHGRSRSARWAVFRAAFSAWAARSIRCISAAACRPAIRSARRRAR
jgi:uncharacterized membrane protein YfcA